MRCDDTLLQIYLDGALSDAERQVTEAHLEGCMACRQTLVEYKVMMWDVEHATPPPVPPELQALSDQLMQTWSTEAARKTAGTWGDASLAWVKTPVIASTLATVSSGGAFVGQSLRKGLMRILWRGGGPR